MKNGRIFLPLIIGFQVLILIGMLVKAYYPIWSGKEYTFKVTPYDPRDIFRGNYARLNYAMNRFPLGEFPHDWADTLSFHYGDPVYVWLKQTDQIYEAKKLSLKKPPASEDFIRGIVAYNYYGSGDLQVNYGIEQYFSNPEKARKLEEAVSFRNDSVDVYVKVMIAPNGVARIKSIECEVCGF